MVAIMKTYFLRLSHEQRGHLIRNPIESIGVTCRSKVAKSTPIGNPRWPPWWPS